MSDHNNSLSRKSDEELRRMIDDPEQERGRRRAAQVEAEFRTWRAGASVDVKRNHPSTKR